MNTKEIIESWRWRIVRAGYTQRSFCDEFGVSRAAMSEYLSQKKAPSLERFDFIENTLKKLGV